MMCLNLEGKFQKRARAYPAASTYNATTCRRGYRVSVCKGGGMFLFDRSRKAGLPHLSLVFSYYLDKASRQRML